METNSATSATPSSPEALEINFKGKGGEYFTIVIVNWLLTVFTLGLYYPWAKARKLQYLYSATEFKNIPFVFHGTGKEMFKGFIKAILIFIIIWVITFILMRYLNMLVLGIVFLYLGILAIIPLAIHGSYRYRMSRTSWSGIRMGYRGDRNKLFGIYFKSLFFTVITLGIYGAWLIMNLRNYLLNNVRLGSLRFTYHGKGSDYFFMNLKGYLLTIVTLGIYFFWWKKNQLSFYVNNLGVIDESTNKTLSLQNKATGGGIAGLTIVNLLLLIFTLGLAYPWIICRTLNFIFSNVAISGDVNMSAITQTEADYKDATGEDITDLLDFGFVI